MRRVPAPWQHATTCSALLALALQLPAWFATASSERIALLVAHPFGGPDLQPLRYTANDVERMRQVLQELGDFEPDQIMVSFGEDADEVTARLASVRSRVNNGQTRSGPGSLFVFYYSGHSQDGELRLGDTRLPLVELKEMIQATGASLRVALLDSCRAGAITRLKGATKGEPITMSVEDSATQSGIVLIAASSEHEDAQESDDIQGSYFTHFLTTALRGAGDHDRDGKVTLSEAYAFAFASTVESTVGTRGGTQHPTYRFDLRGAGDLVLTQPGRPTSAVVLPAGMEGRILLFDSDHRMLIADLHKVAGQETRIAVPPGSYVVKKRERDHLLLQRLRVTAAAATHADPATMEKVDFADDYAKGQVLTAEETRHGRLGIELAAGLGAQTFLSAPVREEYFPTLALLVLTLDLNNALRRNLGVRVDLGLGGSGERSLVISDPFLGQTSYRIEVSELTVGGALTLAVPVGDHLNLRGHARLGFVSVTRRFLAATLPAQTFSTLTPGLGAEINLRLLSWLQAGLWLRFHYMFFNVDESLSLAFLDGGVGITAVLR